MVPTASEEGSVGSMAVEERRAPRAPAAAGDGEHAGDGMAVVEVPLGPVTTMAAPSAGA